MSNSVGNPNLLLALFDWRPREAITPGENFLTEAFVYVLRMNETFRNVLLRSILGSEANDATVTLDTRASHQDHIGGTTIFPDIEITGDLPCGTPFRVLIENKWGARYDPDQITKYARLFEVKCQEHLIFICASSDDYRAALRRQSDFPNLIFKALLWETVYEVLDSVQDKSGMLGELTEFMRHHGLSPGEPITEKMIQGFIDSKGFYPDRLQRLAEKLLREFDWSFLPERHRDTDRVRIKDIYGRLAIEFAPPGWNGAVTIGFLHSTWDHKVPFADSSNNSIDVMMRIEAAPKLGARRTPIVSILEANAEAARKAGGVIRLLNDGVNRNKHTLFIAQRSLADVIKGKASERDQTQAIYEQVKAWAVALFSDGTLEKALAQIGE